MKSINMQRYKNAGTGLLMLILSGCSLAPDYQQPEVDLPATLGETASAEGELSGARLDQWWLAFGDADLNGWVDRTRSANADLGQAAARIQQARAQLGLAGAEQWPLLSAEGNASRTSPSDEQLLPGQDDPVELYSVAGMLSYEVDFLGKFRNAREAARQDFLSSTYGYLSLQNLLVADTVSTYYSLRAAREQLDFAEETVETRRKALEVQQTRYDSGFITQLQLQQAKAELADAEVLIPSLKEQIHQFKTALVILAGADPAEYWNRDTVKISSSKLPKPPAVKVAMAPASLLERRPDIRAAEADLKAAYKNIGVAQAQRWPSLTLSAVLGSSTGEIGNLFSSPTGTDTLAGALTGPIFDFGRNRNRVRSAEAQQAQTYWNYRQVVLKAFGEVSDAMASLELNARQVEARVAQEAAFRRTLELARNQYNEGFSDYLELLDAERRAFDAGLALTETRRRQIIAYIELCKALGGGVKTAD